MEPVELLVFGPHPDDLEIGLGGAVAAHAAGGGRVGLCDLTAGEMGSNGTIEERLAESEAARGVLGALWRVNLRWPDRAIGTSADHVQQAVSLIRRARPRTVAAPYWDDRHPDHVAASRVLTEAAFTAGLRKYETAEPAWRPDWVVYYFINNSAPPSFVIDVSATYEIKRRALACHATQFAPTAPGATETRLTSPLFAQLIESRDAQFGAQIGVPFAEGFIVREPIERLNLFRKPS